MIWFIMFKQLGGTTDVPGHGKAITLKTSIVGPFPLADEKVVLREVAALGDDTPDGVVVLNREPTKDEIGSTLRRGQPLGSIRGAYKLVVIKDMPS